MTYVFLDIVRDKAGHRVPQRCSERWRKFERPALAFKFEVEVLVYARTRHMVTAEDSAYPEFPA